MQKKGRQFRKIASPEINTSFKSSNKSNSRPKGRYLKPKGRKGSFNNSDSQGGRSFGKSFYSNQSKSCYSGSNSRSRSFQFNRDVSKMSSIDVV